MTGWTLDVAGLFLLTILSGTIHWIVARSGIARRFWSRLPRGGWGDNLLRCVACSGLWIGLALGPRGLTPVRTGSWIGDVVVTGILGAFVTPIGQAVLIWARDVSAIPPDPESGSGMGPASGSDFEAR